MTVERYYQGDVGTEIRFQTETDLSTATAIAIAIKKPSGATVIWPGTADDETDAEMAARQAADPYATKTRMHSIVVYTTAADDFDELGRYTGQALLAVLGGARHWRGNAVSFTISPPWSL